MATPALRIHQAPARSRKCLPGPITKVKFENLVRLSVVFLCYTLTFKLVLNSIERKERQKIQTKKGKHEIQKGDEPIYRYVAQLK